MELAVSFLIAALSLEKSDLSLLIYETQSCITYS